jgi:hypothetical protein
MKNDNRKSVLPAIYFALIPVAVFILFASTAFAQDDKYETDDAPPPLKLIAESERKQLNATKDVKGRTKLALDLMQARLTTAAAKSEASEYGSMFTELGAFHAIMDETLNFLDRYSQNSGARLNNFKRLEIGLRRMNPQIDLLRRNAPPERERYLFYLSRNVRDARARAIEPQFGNTVLPQARHQDNQ